MMNTNEDTTGFEEKKLTEVVRDKIKELDEISSYYFEKDKLKLTKQKLEEALKILDKTPIDLGISILDLIFSPK